ncbi:MAG TPA: TonB-dependent receptor [Dongiaceae bacterium]|nr:TonB-dependent receptor [Dongiaceae bacterium]
MHSSHRPVSSFRHAVVAFGAACLAGLASIHIASADDAGSISGTVVSNTGAPVSKAKVSLAALLKQTETDAQGAFHLEGLPPGRYLIEVISARFGSAVVEAPVTAAQVTDLKISLELAVHHEDVIVSASPYGREASSIARPVTVLDGTDLQSQDQPTLGETLARQPGVASTYYSPGVSRPVIRGLGGDRVRMLEDGIGVGDASNVSEDHAVATDVLGTERIEIIRGASTLLYGGNAVGGVVNVIDGRIPDLAADKPIGGAFETHYGTNAGEGDGALALEGGVRQMAWRLSGLKRNSDDFTTPEGTLENSDLETTQSTAGASWVGGKGFIGASYGRFDTNYGIPTDEQVRIDMNQNRWDMQGAWTAPLGFLRGVRVRLGKVDYQHSELESDGAIGTTFLNDSWEGRVEMTHRQAGAFRGSFGFQTSNRDFQAIGDEGFVPPTVTRNRALFAVEQIGTGAVTFEAGARYDNQDNEVADPLLPARSFNGTSLAGSVIWKMPKDYILALEVARSVRLPTAEELYANGPHLATFQFQVGDPNLDVETGLGYDLSFRRTKGRVSGEASLFTTDFNGYISLTPTGNLIDVNGELVPEYVYVQSDANFRGGEAHLDIELLHRDPHHVTLELGADTVRADDTESDEPLPFITPVRYSLGVSYHGPRFWGLVEGRRTNQQDRVAPNETPTDGYTWLNATLGCRLFSGAMVHDLILRGLNLTDELGRDHLSPLKDLVPLPGRDLTLSYRLTF